jgi:pimeloyl-ACP methyl ester carboxylesterase
MAQPIHILYLPGLDDDLDKWRLRALKLWHFRKVSVELVPMTWESGTYAQKLARIDQAIDRAKGKRIVIIGESAGGSMAVHMYARRSDDLYKVMTICGKNTHPEGVSERYYRDNPAFKTSMEHLNESLAELTSEQMKKFVSIHPIYDPTVPVRETLLNGCKEVELWLVGHLPVIGLTLTVLSPILIRAAKRK